MAKKDQNNMGEFRVCKNRDIALLTAGAMIEFFGNDIEDYSIEEDYHPSFEGPEQWRGLPFIKFTRKGRSCKVVYKK